MNMRLHSTAGECCHVTGTTGRDCRSSPAQDTRIARAFVAVMLAAAQPRRQIQRARAAVVPAPSRPARARRSLSVHR
jgi:hypothetical protein